TDHAGHVGVGDVDHVGADIGVHVDALDLDEARLAVGKHRAGEFFKVVAFIFIGTFLGMFTGASRELGTATMLPVSITLISRFSFVNARSMNGLI
ncbi:hypothetical protein DFR52_11044, partial [Hoeflea marina]